MFAPADVRPGDHLPRLLNVASLSRVKDQATLLRAARLLRGRGYAFELEITGSGPLQGELRSMAGRLDDEPSRIRSGQTVRTRAVAEYGLELCATTFHNLYLEVASGDAMALDAS